MNLISRDSLLGFGDERKAEKPLRQRQMCVVKDRARRCGELLFAGFLKALKQFARLLFFAGRLDTRNTVTAANDAANAIGPSHPLKVGKAIIVCGELLMNIYQVHKIITLTQAEYLSSVYVSR